VLYRLPHPQLPLRCGFRGYVAPGKRRATYAEDRFGETDKPHQHAEQQDAEYERQRQSDLARPICLGAGDTGDDDREEDHIVDAENDLERR
jgi:hypothetical protein